MLTIYFLLLFKRYAQILMVSICLLSFKHSCPSTPQQNGVAERKNRHLLDVVHTILLESSVPSMFWVEALKTATHLINCLPSQVLQMESPYFCLFAKQPSYDHLRIFGCVCFVHLPPHE